MSSQQEKKRIERYLGITPPSKKDLKRYSKEFSSTKEFLSSKKDTLKKIRQGYFKIVKHRDQSREIEEELITKFTYDTSRIEGSSLSYKDTKMLLKEGITRVWLEI